MATKKQNLVTENLKVIIKKKHQRKIIYTRKSKREKKGKKETKWGGEGERRDEEGWNGNSNALHSSKYELSHPLKRHAVTQHIFKRERKQA